MIVSQIRVLIAHDDGEFDTERLQGLIEAAIGNELPRGAMFEVRDDRSHEVTLASIVYSLEERAVLEHATDETSKPPVSVE